MPDPTFLIRHKQDGSTFGPLTQKQAEGIANYPEDFEKVQIPKASRAGYDTEQDGTEKTPKRKRARAAAPRSPARARGGGRSATSTAARGAAVPIGAPTAAAEGKES
jgi:hypothetical protein